MSSKNLYKILIIFLIFSLVIFGCSRRDDGTEEDIVDNYVPVEIEKINKKTLENSRRFNGQVIPGKEVMVIPKIVGTVSSVNVELGDYVERGQTLFTIEEDEIRRNLEQSEEGLNIARQGVDQAASTLDTAKTNRGIAVKNLEEAGKDFDRMEGLYKEGAIAKSQLEQAELGLSSAESKINNIDSQISQAEIGLEEASSQVKQAEASKSQMEDSLEHTVVTAPISGLLAQLEVREGGVVTNTQPAAIILDVDNMFVQIHVVEDIVNKISENQSVDISVPAAFSGTTESKITYVSSTADLANKLYSVKAKLDDPDGLVKPGMSSYISLNIDEIEDAISLPRDTILESNGEKFVFIVKDNRAFKRTIKTGADFGDFIEIKKGLSLGDKVITKGHHYVNNGGKIKIVGGDD